MPQEWETHWNLRGETSPQAIDTSAALNPANRAEMRDNGVQTFGNLTLLVQKLNSSVSNGAFTNKKVKIIENSLLRINKFLTEVDDWNEDSIIERGRDLFQIARKIWAYPSNEQSV